MKSAQQQLTITARVPVLPPHRSVTPQHRTHGPALLQSSRLQRRNPAQYPRCRRLVLLQHLRQLLHHRPQVIHVCLLAARRQAVDHGDAVLCGACAVELAGLGRGG